MVFAIRGSSLKIIWPRIVFVTLFAAFVTFFEIFFNIKSYSLTTTPFSLVGLAMAIFLGFRNNESYARFWEGRRLWGQLVNSSRSLTRQIMTFIKGDDAATNSLRQKLVRLIIAHAYSLKNHLRGTPNHELDGVEDLGPKELDAFQNIPFAIGLKLGREIRDAGQDNRISEFHLPVFENSLTEFTNVVGGCERIKKTPIPFAYNVLIHRIVAIYCLALPFGLVQTVGVLTPVVVCLISYAFFGLDAIGDDVEQPFEEHENDLPLDAICRTIEIDLLQAIGEPNIPAPIEPKNGILL